MNSVLFGRYFWLWLRYHSGSQGPENISLLGIPLPGITSFSFIFSTRLSGIPPQLIELLLAGWWYWMYKDSSYSLWFNHVRLLLSMAVSQSAFLLPTHGILNSSKSKSLYFLPVRFIAGTESRVQFPVLSAGYTSLVLVLSLMVRD